MRAKRKAICCDRVLVTGTISAKLYASGIQEADSATLDTLRVASWWVEDRTE